MLPRRDGSLLASLADRHIIALNPNRQRTSRFDPRAVATAALAETVGRHDVGRQRRTVRLEARGGRRRSSITISPSASSPSPTRDGRDVWAASLGTGAVRIDRARSGHAARRHARERPARRNAVDDSRRPRRQPLVRPERRRVAIAQRLPRVRRVDRAHVAAASRSKHVRRVPEWRDAMWVATGGGVAAMTATGTNTLTVAERSALQSGLRARGARARDACGSATAAGVNCLSFPAKSRPQSQTTRNARA
jgi:hypothetical protein